MNASPKRPPHKITSDDSALVCYAVLDESVGYTSGHGLLFVDGKEIGKVPCLAICKNKQSGLYTLYYCDSDWSATGVATNYESVESAQRRANRIYPGSSMKWMQAS